MGKLEGMGYPRDLVEAYVRGQQALADQAIGEVHQVVGGSDQYAKMMQWAQRALDDSARDAFNAQVQSGDMQVGKEAVKGLHARYLAAQGSTAPLLEGSRTNGAPANAFRSEAEVVAAMQDPRYMNPAKADPAYVRDVNERLRNSELFTPQEEVAMDVVRALFSSKKFVAMLAGLVATLVAKIGLESDEATVTQIVSLVAVYIGGQGLADMGKEKAKAESAK